MYYNIYIHIMFLVNKVDISKLKLNEIKFNTFIILVYSHTIKKKFVLRTYYNLTIILYCTIFAYNNFIA